MADDLSTLKKNWLFRARMEKGSGNHQAQVEWLFEQFKAIEAGGLAEVTSLSFAGESSSSQYRGPSPQDQLNAIQAAIEDLEALIDGQVASSFSKPFGFRFSPSPAVVLDNAAGL